MAKQLEQLEFSFMKEEHKAEFNEQLKEKIYGLGLFVGSTIVGPYAVVKLAQMIHPYVY